MPFGWGLCSQVTDLCVDELGSPLDDPEEGVDDRRGGAQDDQGGEHAGGVDLVQLGFAALFLVLAGVSWTKRPKGGDAARDGAATADSEPAKSKLLDRLDGLSVLGALGVGLAQGFVVIKNIPLALGAGARFGEAGLHGSEAIAALILFAFIASLGVVVPLVVALIGGPRLEVRLRSLRTWLEANMSSITIVVLLVLGGYFLGQGLGILD